MPKISIVLPVFNGERYLDQAIGSIIVQTFFDWELIIVDDCSTDSTPHIIKKWTESDARIKSVRNQKNKKLPGSLNEGFRHAAGDYYTWTSDDNLLQPDALATMASVLDENPQYDLVYCDIDRIDENGESLGKGGFSGPPVCLFLFNVVQACFLYRKEIHEKLNGYDESLFLVEDYDFWIRAFRSFRFCHIKKTLYHYRIHDASLTSTKTK